MNAARLRAVVIKEWQEVRTNRAVIGTFVLLSLLFLAIALGLGFGLVDYLLADLAGDPVLDRMLAGASVLEPRLADLEPRMQFQVVFLQQMVALFLVLPIMGAMGIATFSIVGEKTSRSLEAVLATPVTAAELLLGKSLAAATPAVLGTWAVFAVFAAGVLALGGRELAGLIFDRSAWLTIVLIAPLMSVLALGAGVIVSSRVSDPRSAQQVGGLIVLPIVAYVAARSAGVFLAGPGFVLGGALVLLVLDALVLWLGARLFRREYVLVRWR